VAPIVVHKGPHPGASRRCTAAKSQAADRAEAIARYVSYPAIATTRDQRLHMDAVK
jgi:hypothetical protein